MLEGLAAAFALEAEIKMRMAKHRYEEAVARAREVGNLADDVIDVEARVVEDMKAIEGPKEAHERRQLL